ncbi:MAG TPA: M23 family metallopeptidase [Baekduia sp.]|nr:M23 family metallopeptidase [Baekduia sp.]
MPSIAIVLLAALALTPAGAAVASIPHDRWRRPLEGAVVVRAFSFDPATPYLGGRRRGVDLRARPGAAVRAACSGTVTHAGRVPRWGLGVTVRCGRLVATELGLGSLGVRRGAHVVVGGRLGALGSRAVLRLGARRAGARQGYVDPLALLGGGGSGAPVAPPEIAPRPRPRPPRAPVASSPIAPRSAPAADAIRHALSPTIWVGLGLLAAGAGGGGVARRRRRGRPAPGRSVAHRYR